MTWFVGGISTDVGKTVVSAILTQALQADYWKPVQCGHLSHTDSVTVRLLTEPHPPMIYPEAYCFADPVSPHYAARLAGTVIHARHLAPPVHATKRPLVIELAGGLLAPLTTQLTLLDVFAKQSGYWILVSKHYLGSINHTLLSIEALKRRGITRIGLLFNGDHNPASEEAILQLSGLPCVGRLLPEPALSSSTIGRYAQQWTPALQQFALQKASY